MVVTANGEMVLTTLEDLKLLFESETQELHEQFRKYKKYERQLDDLEEWEVGDITGFIDDVETLICKNKLNKDSEYRLAVYVGRYPSYFNSIKTSDKSKEETLNNRLRLLRKIEEDIQNYIEVLVELE